jgi:hypothetical protein
MRRAISEVPPKTRTYERLRVVARRYTVRPSPVDPPRSSGQVCNKLQLTRSAPAGVHAHRIVDGGDIFGQLADGDAVDPGGRDGPDASHVDAA